MTSTIYRRHICLVLIVVFIKRGTPINTTLHAETQLQYYLFDGYNPNVRPSVDGESITVHVGLSLNHVVEINESKQTLTASVTFNFVWKDGLLVWKENEYKGIDYISVPARQLWLPDILIVNGAFDAYDIGFATSRTKLYKDGSIHVWTQTTKEFTCDIRTKKFPFDKHQCSIVITSSISDMKTVNLMSSSRNVRLDYYKPVAEWKLVENNAEVNIVEGCIGNASYYPVVNFNLTFKRNCKTCILNDLLPVLLLSMLNILTFFVPIASGEKLAYPMSIFLTVAVFLTAINEHLPEAVDGVSYLAIWVALELCYCAMTLFCTVLILRLHHSMGESKVPDVLSKFVYMFIKTKTCAELQRKIRVSDTREIDEKAKSQPTFNAPKEDNTTGYEHEIAGVIVCGETDDLTWTDVCETIDRVFAGLFLIAQLLSGFVFIGLFLS